jgi:hypothetical protein
LAGADLFEQRGRRTEVLHRLYRLGHRTRRQRSLLSDCDKALGTAEQF